MTISEIEVLLSQSEAALNADKYHKAEMIARQIINELSSGNQGEFPNNSEGQRLVFLSRANRLVSLSFLKRGRAIDALPYADEALEFAQIAKSKVEEGKGLGILGSIYKDVGSYNTALDYYSKSIAIQEMLIDEPSIARTAGNIGIIYCNLGDYDKALDFFARSLSIHEKLGDKSSVALVMGNFGIVSYQLGSYTVALDYFSKALIVHDEFGDLSAFARSMGNIGMVYSRLGTYDLALDYYKKALEIHEKLGNSSSIAHITNNIGLMYEVLGDYRTSLDYFTTSLSINEELGAKVEAAKLMGNIGGIYASMYSYELSLKYYSQSLAILEELGDKHAIAKFSGNLGTVYYELGSYEKALEYFTHSIILLETLGDKSAIASMKGNIGNVYFCLQSFDMALDYYTKALAMHEELDEKLWIARVSGNLGCLYSSKNFIDYNPIRSEELLLKAVVLCKELGVKKQLIDQYRLLKEFYKDENRWQESQEYFEKYHELYIEVQNEVVKKQADKFEWERKISDLEKEREIELVKTDAEKALLHETILHQKNRLETQAYEIENSIQELVKKNGLFQQIQSDIKKIIPHTKREGIDYIEQLQDRVSRHITPLDSVKELDKQWIVIHNCFIKNLQQSFPDLTTMELKIAVLLNMKFTSSNISSALFLAKRTVEFHRHNLRKKMHIDTNRDIYIELAKYSS